MNWTHTREVQRFSTALFGIRAQFSEFQNLLSTLDILGFSTAIILIAC